MKGEHCEKCSYVSEEGLIVSGCAYCGCHNPPCGNCHEDHRGNTYCYGAKLFGLKKEPKSEERRETVMTPWIKFLIWLKILSPCCGTRVYIWQADIFGDRQRGICENCNKELKNERID